ncbi:MAG: hypothetical protein U9R14_03475 [Patescibacteria group bacterium]|nr:hypothetical protein [Patescibacteria group bacterium]
MFKSKSFITLIIIIFTAIIISGCSVSFKTKDGGGYNGGVYKTVNKGNTWRQKALIPTISGKPKNIGGLNVNSMAMDPSDNHAIYFGSHDNGLFYAYDGADNWQVADKLGKITIKAVAVDPGSKCIIYTASVNKVHKSTDCNRTWSQVYYDNNVNVTVNTIAIDYYDSANLYIGTSRGEVIKSSDRGVSWQTIQRLEDDVKKIVISPYDSRVVFAATAKKGIYRSTDSGKTWADLSEKLKEFKDSMKFRDLTATDAEAGVVVLATDYGLLRSFNNGETWTKIELITPEKKATINAVAVSPNNSKEIYYVTNTTFYRSIDGGENWTTKKLPTARAGWKLLIDPKDTNIIYLGVRSLK